MLCLLILLSSIAGKTEIEVSVAKGTERTIPKKFVHISTLDQLEIKQSYWAKVDISETEEGNFILQGGKPNLSKIHFFTNTGHLFKIGNRAELELHRSDTSFFLYYPFVDEKDGNLLSVTLQEKTLFLEKVNNEQIIQFAFHAFLLFPLLVSLVLFLRTKSSVYLYYALYILSLMGFFGYQYGILGQILPVVNEIPPMWIWFISFLQTTFYLLFSTSFLDLPKFDALANRLIKAANWFLLGFFVLSVCLYLMNIDVQHSITYKIPFWSVQVFLIMWFVIRIFKHPSSIKVYYLTGFFILFVVSLSGQILSVNQNATNYNYLFQIGLVMEVFILALGLSARVNEIQKDKDLAQNKLIDQLRVNKELQKEYTDKLENTVRKRTESLNLRNRENEMLLKEVHHRVKNNLQMITSMINMYNRRSDSEEVEGVLVATRNKIKSMALIHEHLYSHEDFSSVVLDEYLSRLVHMVISSLHKGNHIDLKLKIDNIVSDIQTSISLGLILNELVTNSLKYAFQAHSKPSLTVEIKEIQNELVFKVEDNGQEIVKAEEDGLGYTIIKSIIDNMDGRIVQEPSSNGYKVEISLKDYALNN